MLRSDLWQLLWSTCGHQGTEGLVRRSGDSRSEIQNHGVAGPQTSHGRFAGGAGALWASRGTRSQRKNNTDWTFSLPEYVRAGSRARSPETDAAVQTGDTGVNRRGAGCRSATLVFASVISPRRPICLDKYCFLRWPL